MTASKRIGLAHRSARIRVWLSRVRFVSIASVLSIVYFASFTGAEPLVPDAANTRTDRGSFGEDVDFRRIQAQIMNPCGSCGGKPLVGSYCEIALKLKDQIENRAAAGMSEADILDSFVTEYGPSILTLPERSGFNLFAWILPLFALILGASALVGFVRRSGPAPSRARDPRTDSPVALQRSAAEGHSSPSPTKAHYRERLAREIADV